MAGKTQIKEFIAYAKICSSKLSYKYVVMTNNGRDTDEHFIKLRLLKSYIHTVESYAGIKRKPFLSVDCICDDICIKTCLNSKEICNIVKKIKSICKTC